MNKQIVKKLSDLRPVFCTVRRGYASNSSKEDFFKFYSDNVRDSQYRSLTEQDYNRFISTRGARREPALTRQVTTLAYKVGKKMISLAEGMPNEHVFPYDSLSVSLKNGKRITLDGKELAAALQYVPTQGLPALLSELRQFTFDVHRPPPLDRDVIVTNGAQHGIYLCMELLMNPGDAVIISEYAYTGAQIALKPMHPDLITIPEDVHGINPDILEPVLHDRLVRGQKMPKLMYLIPTGSNPTGTVIPEERRHRIYDLACKYDFLIIEDDPYMFINYGEKRVPSFLSMDTTGRVIRLDSWSKTVSSGLRAAWVTGPTPLIQRFDLHMQAELLHSCTLGQALFYHLMLDRESLAKHLMEAQDFYRRRRDALKDSMGPLSGLADWNVPEAGLFFWVKIRGVDDVYKMVFQTAFDRSLMMVPGHAFQYNASAPSQFVRLTFSKIRLEDMDVAMRTLADIIREEQSKCLQKPQRLVTER